MNKHMQQIENALDKAIENSLIKLNAITSGLFYIYDENKNVIPSTLEESLYFCSDLNNKIIKNQRVGHYRISTVFLRCDHNTDPDNNTPILFETMVFNVSSPDEPWRDIYCKRYSTYNEALSGHEKAVKWVKNGCKNQSTNQGDE